MEKDSLRSPMHVNTRVTARKGGPGVYDHNPHPPVTQPRSKGKDAESEKFYEELKGDPAALSTPMGTAAVEPRRPLKRK